MRYLLNFTFILFCFVSFSQNGLPPHPKNYVCYKVNDQLNMDGKINEPAWLKAEWTDIFADIEGPSKPKPTHETRAKMLWDDTYLYLAAYLEEPHIWAMLKERESIIYYDNDFEVFIDPVPDNYHYAEIEVNAFGTIMDLLLARPYRNGVVPSFGWDCKGLLLGIDIQGTINNPTDKDTAWVVEMAIPLKSISDLVHKRYLPKAGDQWKINFSRVQWDTKIENGEYIKLKKPEHNWVWSPQWAINMHKPEYWGYLQFSDTEIGKGKEDFIPDPHWIEKMQLMAIFEAQRKYRSNEKSYTPKISELALPDYVEANSIVMEATSRQFTAWIKLKNTTLFVDNTGRLWQERD